jgi:transcription elongation factor GreA
MATEQKYTREGFEKLKEEYETRTKVERERILNAIAEARSFGDLSENAEYDAARNDQAKNETRIRELEELIQHAIVVDDSAVDSSVVGLGSFVKVEKDGKEAEYKIVGSNEANPFENKISDMSPVGRALIGAKVGDTVKVETPARVVTLKVLHVSKVQ